MADMGSVPTTRINKTAICLCSLLLFATGRPVIATEPISVSDASLSAAFYSDSSCLLTIDSDAQPGKTIIDADVDNDGSRMLIHCDTDDGRRLTLLARGDSLNVSQLVPLLTREEIEEGELGMIAWLTRSGVHYSDDNAPRRYVIAGSVLLRKSPPLQVAGNALHSQRHAFGRVTGVLEPLLNSTSVTVSEALPMVDSADTDQVTKPPEGVVDEKPEVVVDDAEPATDTADATAQNPTDTTIPEFSSVNGEQKTAKKRPQEQKQSQGN